MQFGRFALTALAALVAGTHAANAIAPKVMIVTLFELERDAWLSKMPLSRNVSLPGLSPLFPNAACDDAGDVCMITTGEGEINAASSMSALVYSSAFDLRKTYFVVNGIAGVNPDVATIGSVGFPRFAIQAGLQYGLDGRQIPQNWTYSFWNYGTDEPGQRPPFYYGTELFELNTNLRDKVFNMVNHTKLNDTQATQSNRAMFSKAPANAPPAVFKGDVSTSDLYFGGHMLYVPLYLQQRRHGNQPYFGPYEWHGCLCPDGAGGQRCARGHDARYESEPHRLQPRDHVPYCERL